MKLFKARLKDILIVEKINLNDKYKRKLLSIGLEIEQKIILIYTSPIKGMYLIKIYDGYYCISEDIAENIEVRRYL